MSSPDDLSLAEDSQDELLSEVNDDDVPQNGDGEDTMGDLFGDDESDQEAPSKRTLDNEQLDSGDDEQRQDRVRSESVEIEEKETQFSAVTLPRHLVPDPGDNELYLFKVPHFLSLEPHVYDAQTFEPPKHDHHSTEASTAFSAYNTALTTIRWRHSPSDPSELQSNGRVIRWSDGSLTMQLATDPSVQYDISGKPLAPAQSNPPKPTPLQAMAKRKRGSAYNIRDESWTYLYSPLPSAYALRAVGKVTTSLQVHIPAKDESGEALEASLAALAAKYGDKGLGPKTITITKPEGDPLKSEKDAQKIEREILRKARKEDRDRERNIKFGQARSGGGGGRAGGGLTIDSLEGDGFGRPKAQRAKGPRRIRRDEYSDEEDELYGRRGGPQDTYDMEDDFLVESEDDEGGSEDAEGDEDIDDVIERQMKNSAKKPSPKRAREEDAGNTPASPVSRAKRRRVVDSDEESE